MIPSRQPFDFLGLPPEIRRHIYSFAFVKRGAYIGSSKNHKATSTETFKTEARLYRNRQFLLSFREAYEEGEAMYFSRNGFAFYNMTALSEFLQAVGIDARRKLTKSLKLDARYVPMGADHCWWSYSVCDAQDLFLGTDDYPVYGEVEACGRQRNLKRADDDPMNETLRLSVRGSLKLALLDIVHQRDSPNKWSYLPDVFTGKPRSWKSVRLVADRDEGDRVDTASPDPHWRRRPSDDDGNGSPDPPGVWYHPNANDVLYRCTNIGGDDLFRCEGCTLDSPSYFVPDKKGVSIDPSPEDTDKLGPGFVEHSAPTPRIHHDTGQTGPVTRPAWTDPPDDQRRHSRVFQWSEQNGNEGSMFINRSFVDEEPVSGAATHVYPDMAPIFTASSRIFPRNTNNRVAPTGDGESGAPTATSNIRAAKIRETRAKWAAQYEESQVEQIRSPDPARQQHPTESSGFGPSANFTLLPHDLLPHAAKDESYDSPAPQHHATRSSSRRTAGSHRS